MKNCDPLVSLCPLFAMDTIPRTLCYIVQKKIINDNSVQIIYIYIEVWTLKFKIAMLN